jgi:pantoate--beta-alanine ligase
MEIKYHSQLQELNETNMLLFKQSGDLIAHLQQARDSGQTIGFVPSMGALHEGHLSLIERSVKETDITVCSIFINPTQFNDQKDFQQYPVTIEKDILLLEGAGTTILFLPSVATIYPNGMGQLPHYDLGHLEQVMEGKYRPGHFQGVCQVMHRLLELVAPDHLYMGAKDYQQCMVVQRLMKIIGSKAAFHPCPTLREPDGLAMSSRNTRLNPDERQKAVAISQTLHYIKEHMKTGSLQHLKQAGKAALEQHQFRVDYVEIADAQSLEIIDSWNGSTPAVALIAAFIGAVRLIDNMELSN